MDSDNIRREICFKEYPAGDLFEVLGSVALKIFQLEGFQRGLACGVENLVHRIKDTSGRWVLHRLE